MKKIHFSTLSKQIGAMGSIAKTALYPTIMNIINNIIIAAFDLKLRRLSLYIKKHKTAKRIKDIPLHSKPSLGFSAPTSPNLYMSLKTNESGLEVLIHDRFDNIVIIFRNCYCVI